MFQEQAQQWKLVTLMRQEEAQKLKLVTLMHQEEAQKSLVLTERLEAMELAAANAAPFKGTYSEAWNAIKGVCKPSITFDLEL